MDEETHPREVKRVPKVTQQFLAEMAKHQEHPTFPDAFFSLVMLSVYGLQPWSLLVCVVGDLGSCFASCGSCFALSVVVGLSTPLLFLSLIASEDLDDVFHSVSLVTISS